MSQFLTPVEVITCSPIPTWSNIMTSALIARAYRDVISYSCADNQSFADGSIADVKTSTCGIDGVWYPNIERCAGTVIFRLHFALLSVFCNNFPQFHIS